MKILTSKQMEDVDRLTTERFGVPGLILMENAGFFLFTTLSERFEDLDSKRIGILCGPGNNGGDGFVLARQLLQRDIPCEVFLLADPKRLRGDSKINYGILSSAGVALEVVPSLSRWLSIRERLREFDILADGLLGTGINRPISPDSLIGAAVSDINTSSAFVLAIDIPSGLNSDSCRGGDLCVYADVTATFTAPKIAQILSPDLEAVGELRVGAIGSPCDLLDGNPEHFLNLVTPDLAAVGLFERPVDAHKGTCGHVVVVGGSLGKGGAVSLAARAALRAGAGLVTAVVPRGIQDQVAASLAELMTLGVPSSHNDVLELGSVEEILDFMSDKSAAALGPGMGTAAETCHLIHELFDRAPIPLVVDADGLNALAARSPGPLAPPEAPRVLTPHPGEFARLVGLAVPQVLEDKIGLARRFAEERGLWLVLKGFRTLVANPQGEVFACPLGNPGMATAGMGDALTGVLAAALAGAEASEPDSVTSAVVCGVYVHSLAGDLAERQFGVEALTAGDLISHLGSAFRRLRAEAAP